MANSHFETAVGRLISNGPTICPGGLMECPFCLEDFNDEALVCKGCGRDLRLVRPLIDENLP